MEIGNEIFSSQRFISCTNKSRVTSSVYHQAWNKRTFYTKSNTFHQYWWYCRLQDLYNFWIYDVISPHMENSNIRCHIRFVQSGTNIMVKMFKCCTTKEATTAVNIVKSTFQVFNVYLFGDVYLLSPKKTIILLPLLVFLFKTWFKRQVRTKIIRATGEEYFWGIVWWIRRWYYNCYRDCILVKRISPFFDGLLKIFPSFSRTSSLH